MHVDLLQFVDCVLFNEKILRHTEQECVCVCVSVAVGSNDNLKIKLHILFGRRS